MLSKRLQSSLTRALLTYAVGCFVLLQVSDILLEPLGLPVSTIRWLMLLMLAFAPVLVAAVSWQQLGPGPREPGANQDSPVNPVYRVEGAEVDTATRQIRFGGKRAEVQPKVFDLIEYLIRERDRVVSKDELFDEIWPSVVVSEASLTQSIKRARDLFRQHGFDGDVIRTVSRKGYQFDFPVTVAASGVVATSATASMVVIPTLAMMFVSFALGFFILNRDQSLTEVAVSDNSSSSIAVLPFRNLTNDEDFVYFSDGLTETVTNSLTRVRGLRVIARGSAFNFRDESLDSATVAERLQIGHLVQGSVQRNGDDLRVSASLIRATDGSQLWSQIYTREFNDVFSLHDDIARAIVEQMSGVLTTSLNLPTDADQLIGNADASEAYRLLLRGRELRRNASSQELENAERLFRLALELKPDYAEAMVALSDVVRVRAVTGNLPRESSFAEALSLARNAAALDPTLSEALVQIGEIQHRHFWDFEDAASSYNRAIEINPGSASAHSAYGRFLAKAGRHEEAASESRVAVDLNPLSTNAHTSLIIRQIRADELDQGRQQLDEFKLLYPDHFDIPWLETNWHIRNGSYRDALQWIALEELEYLRLSLSAIILNYLGRTGQAETALNELIETDGDGAAFQIAEVYAHWQQADEAFRWLEHAFSQGDPGLSELYSSVNLENLYQDSRFPEIAERIGLPPL